MSNVDDLPQGVTLEQINAGLAKFVTTLEEEIAIHHSHPEWMDLDERCREEENLIVRAGIIIEMLEEAIAMFKLDDENENVLRFESAKLYFDTTE